MSRQTLKANGNKIYVESQETLQPNGTKSISMGFVVAQCESPEHANKIAAAWNHLHNAEELIKKHLCSLPRDVYDDFRKFLTSVQ